jgi:hypothetical protein
MTKDQKALQEAIKKTIERMSAQLEIRKSPLEMTDKEYIQYVQSTLSAEDFGYFLKNRYLFGDKK